MRKTVLPKLLHLAGLKCLTGMKCGHIVTLVVVVESQGQSICGSAIPDWSKRPYEEAAQAAQRHHELVVAGDIANAGLLPNHGEKRKDLEMIGSAVRTLKERLVAPQV